MNLIPLRLRQRIGSMREIQAVALELFRKDGFELVTVDAVADASGVSASTIYRWFGTKEGMVLWDDFDRPVTRDLMTRIQAGDSAFNAVRGAFSGALAEAIEADHDAQLNRISYIFETPQLLGAAAQNQVKDQAELASLFEGLLDADDEGLTARVLAGACLAALDAALGHWCRLDGAEPLPDLISAAFDALDLAR